MCSSVGKNSNKSLGSEIFVEKHAFFRIFSQVKKKTGVYIPFSCFSRFSLMRNVIPASL